MKFRLFVMLGFLIPLGLAAQKNGSLNRKLDDAKFNLFHVKDYTIDEGDFALFLSSIRPSLSDKKQNNIIANFDWTSAYLIRKGIEYKHVDSIKYGKLLKMVDNATNSFYDIKRIKMVLNFIDSLSPEVLSHTKFIQNISPFSDFLDKSIVYILDDIFEGLDASAIIDIDIQNQIDAIRASENYLLQSNNSGDYSGKKRFGESDVTEYVNISNSFDIKSTVKRFLDSLNTIDKSLNGKLNKEKQADWNDLKSYIDFLVKNNIVYYNNYAVWEVSDDLVNSLIDDLNFIDKRVNENATNFWMLYNSGNFFDSVLNSERIGISTRTVLKEYYPSASVNRIWIETDTVFSKDTTNDFDSRDTTNLIVWQVNPDSMPIVQRLMEVVEDRASDTTAVEDAYADDYSYRQLLNSKTFGIEPFVMKFYNNFNEINEVLKSEGLIELSHLNTVGLTFVYQPSDNTRYRFSYGRTMATDQKLNICESYWGDNFMFSTESNIFNKRFASLSWTTNLNYMRNSMTFPNGFQMGDPLVTNPQEINQVTKNSFLYGLGLNGKIGFSKFHLIGEVGYLWDYGDGRWKYNDNYINGKGRMSNRGLYFSVGLGVNIYQKYK
jgi:hypothetical protein